MQKELTNDSALLSKPLSTNTDVPGNIHKECFFDFWVKVLKVDSSFQTFLKEGYAIPFEGGVPPPRSLRKNNRSFLENKEFAITEIHRLEKLKCIYRTDEQPEVVLPLSVVYSKKWRLVVDASQNLNPYVNVFTRIFPNNYWCLNLR